MDDRFSENRVESRLRRAYDKETLTPDQRRQHLNRLAEARGKKSESMLRPGWKEMAVVASMVVVVLAVVAVIQGLPGQDTVQQAAQPTLPPGEWSAKGVVSVDDMRMLATEPAPGTGFTYTVAFTTEVRTDLSLTISWEAEIWDRTLDDGSRQQRVIVRSPIDEIIAGYYRNSDDWFWFNRGWVERGSMDQQVNPPYEVTEALAAPAAIVEMLDGGTPPDPDNMPSKVEIEYGPEASAGVAWIAKALGLSPFRHVAELSIEPATVTGEDSYIKSMEHMLIGPSDSVSIGRFTYYTEPQTDSESFLDSLFAIPEGDPERFVLAENVTLPFELELFDQNLMTPEGGERITLGSETAQMELLISPSLGGFNAPLWDTQADETWPNTETVIFALDNGTEVYRRQSVDDGPIVAAVWDDGRYLYRTIAIPLDWTDLELRQLAKALSSQ